MNPDFVEDTMDSVAWNELKRVAKVATSPDDLRRAVDERLAFEAVRSLGLVLTALFAASLVGCNWILGFEYGGPTFYGIIVYTLMGLSVAGLGIAAVLWQIADSSGCEQWRRHLRRERERAAVRAQNQRVRDAEESFARWLHSDEPGAARARQLTLD